MLKIALAAVLLVAVGCLTVNARSATEGIETSLSPEMAAKEASYKINFDPSDLTTKYCSATAVGPNTLLTAQHCAATINYNKDLLVDGAKVKIVHVIEDGLDHALIVTDMKFPVVAMIGKWPAIGDDVFIWGNSMFNEFLRRGYVSTFVWDKPFITIPAGTGWMVIDMQTSGGDSGAGLFDKSGRIVGAISGRFSGGPLTFATVMPFNFDHGEIKRYVSDPERQLSPKK